MSQFENPVIRFLNLAGTVVGLLTGLITLYAYVATDGNLLSLFGVKNFDELAAWARAFGERWTFGPLLTALALYGIVTVIVFALDRWELAPEYLGTLVLLFPLPGAWIWLFSDVVGAKGLLLFLFGYVGIPWLAIVAPLGTWFAVSEWLERRRAFVGIVHSVTRKTSVFLGYERIEYTLILTRDGDLPVKVTYGGGWPDERPPEPGARLRVSGRWDEGVFAASRIDALPTADAHPTAGGRIPE